jgi:hypothetical protein
LDPVTSPNELQVNHGDISFTLRNPGRDIPRTLSMLEQLLKFVPPEATAAPPSDTPGNRESDVPEEQSCASATADEKAVATVEAIAPPTPKHDVHQFLEECCEFIYQGFISTADLRTAYGAWCRARGETPYMLGRRALIAAVLEAGGRSNRSRRVNGRQVRTVDGVRLKSSVGPLQLSIVPAEGLARA